jgi:hypothetical protein
MSNGPLRKDTNDDRARNAANESHRPGQAGDVNKSAGAPSTNPATIPTKPCDGDTSCEMPLGSGVPQQVRYEQPGADESKSGDVASRGQGSDGFGGGGAGTEHTRGAHARGAPGDTKDDRHPGSGWRDERSVTPPATQQPPRQQPGRPKDQNADQQPVSTGGAGETTNRPGGNPNVTPRTGEKTKTYEGPTGVSGEAGSNADDT